MSSCKKETTKKYKTRKGPPYHAKDCKGAVKMGNDGDKYISEPDKRGVYKWNKTKKLKTSKANAKIYKIHDNGSVPYVVMMKPNSKVEVIKQKKMALPIKKYWRWLILKFL